MIQMKLVRRLTRRRGSTACRSYLSIFLIDKIALPVSAGSYYCSFVGTFKLPFSCGLVIGASEPPQMCCGYH